MLELCVRLILFFRTKEPKLYGISIHVSLVQCHIIIGVVQTQFYTVSILGHQIITEILDFCTYFI